VKRVDPTPFKKEGLMMPDMKVDFHEWRMGLKRHLMRRDKVCRSCGGPFGNGIHMHEGIFSRVQVVGWPRKWRVLIHCELNCVLLHPNCNLGRHGMSPPPREQVWNEHCEMYGSDVMMSWVSSLPFKYFPAWIR